LPPPVAVIVDVVPLQPAAELTVGVGLTAVLTVPVAVAVQPAALVTVTVYDAGMTDVVEML